MFIRFRGRTYKGTARCRLYGVVDLKQCVQSETPHWAIVFSPNS
jgi:hypothetical protein